MMTSTTDNRIYQPSAAPAIDDPIKSDPEAPPKYEHFEQQPEQESLLPRPQSHTPRSRRRSSKTGLWNRLLTVFIVSSAILAFISLLRHLPSLQVRCGPWRTGRPAVAMAGLSRLATHYTLPSGDKIPSVALGMSSSIFDTLLRELMLP